MDINPKPWQCPECGGEWLYNFVFRHKVNQCSILDSEDRTQAADYFDLERINGRILRAASTSEIALYNTIAAEPLPTGEPIMTDVSGIPAMRTRVVAGLNPDEITE